MMDGYSDSKEKTVISLLKELSTLNLWNYYFRDLPIDVSLAVTNQAVEISKLIAAEDISGLLNKIEKETAKAAVNYLKDYFFKNQIKASFGAMEVKYKTAAGSVDSPFQYIIIYSPIDEERGRVVIRIYSPKEIIPPASSGSIGMTKGFLNSLDSGQKIPPFIVEISGEMKKGMYGSYNWEYSPSIKTVFPAKVPDFGLKPKTWQEKYIADPIKKKINDVLSIGSFFGFQTEIADYILKDGNTDKINEEIKDMKEGDDVAEKYPEEEKTVAKKEEQKEKEIEVTANKKEKTEKKEEKFIPAPCSKNGQTDGRHNIIFSEIAWMGTQKSSNDEWMELKNVSGKEIDLNGYAISNKEGKIDIIFGPYILKPGGFVLLERTDDVSVPFKQADVIYKGALSNTNEELYLFDSSCNVEDYVSANPTWQAGDNDGRRTMERMNDFSWLTYSGSGNGSILGTPGEANSQGQKKEEKKEETKKSSSAIASVAVSFSGGGPDPVAVNYCSQEGTSSPTRQIVINEVAWMGSNTSSSNEWIELKNISESAIELNGWQLLDQGNQIKVVFSSSDIINPGGFYLLERSGDDSVLGIQGDKVYTGALSDTNESLRLFDENCVLVDEILASPDWPAGNKEEKKTMERSDDLSWHTYFNSFADAISGLWGTPKSTNSIEAGDNEEETPPQEENDPNPEEEDENPVVALLITEVQFDESGGNEYIELFNPSDEEIDLCASENDCYYLSYYSSASTWSDSHRNWRFMEGETILPDSYYIVNIFGESGGDWRVEKSTVAEGESPYYSNGQMSESGSVAIFSGNPRYGGEEEKTEEEKDVLAASMKIDAVSWGSDALVKEGSSLINIEAGKVVGRKWSALGYQDTGDNASDFQAEIASPRSHAPKPPSKIDGVLAAENLGQKNSVVLSWAIPEDDDTPAEEISYEIYYSRNGEIDEGNLLKMDDYVSFTIAPAENSHMTALIPDLYYSSDYSFAIKAKDPQGNYSPLSDSISFLIPSAVHQKPGPLYDFKRSNQAKFEGPTDGNMGETFLLAGENDGNPNNDQFSYFLAIDENGTVYFWARIDGNTGIYAYSPEGEQKWVYSVPCAFDPSLGSDGSVIFSTCTGIVSLSPSGKLNWQKDFLKVYTTHIAIDSRGRIYFVASEEPDNAAIFSFDGNSIENKLQIGSLINFTVTELVIDDNDNVYFSKGDTIFRIDSFGGVIEKSFPVEIVSGYSGPRTGRVDQIQIASDGTVLFNLAQGWCCYDVQSTIDVFYAVSNDLSRVLWTKKEYGPVLGVNGDEVYVSLSYGSYKIKAVSLSDGSHRWIKGPFFPPTSRVVSDSGGNIYFAYNLNILGYDPSIIVEESPSAILSFSDSQPFGYAFPSIGNNVMYLVQNNRILGVKY
ncbi:MAG: lamin tail domain-containing protein [Candidatus Paceibacterota bacterium]